MARQTVVLLLLCSVLCSTAHSETFHSGQVAARSASFDCLDWKIIGVCFWLYCTPKGCTVLTSFKVQHHLPDLTVTSYPHQSPWLEYRYLNQAKELIPNPLAPERQGGDIGRQSQRGSAVCFKEAQVIGNPAARFSGVANVPFLCKSKVKPLHVYFDSKHPRNAPLWRNGDSLQHESWVAGVREIGDWPAHTWGAVYPHTGFLLQSEDPKAAAVITQRAVDIVINNSPAFTYTSFAQEGHRSEMWGEPRATDKESCELSGGIWLPPNPYQAQRTEGRCLNQHSVQWLLEADEKTDRWQMISPLAQDHCETFGADGDWSFGKQSEDGNYAFNYWRKYQCCMPSRGRYLFSIEWD